MVICLDNGGRAKPRAMQCVYGKVSPRVFPKATVFVFFLPPWSGESRLREFYPGGVLFYHPCDSVL